MQNTLQKLFDHLIGLPLTKTTRSGLVQYFHFGKTHHTTPQGLILDIGELTLALNCPWLLDIQGVEPIKYEQIYMRKREAGLPTPVWDWKVPGSSLRDQRLMELTHDNPNLIVSRVEQPDQYSLILYFNDNSVLTVLPDLTANENEYWQLFSNIDKELKAGAGPEGLIL